MKRASLRMSSSRFQESTISEIAKTDGGIVVLKTNGDIAMFPNIYDYSDKDRSLIYCMVVAMLDLGVISAEDTKSFMETNDQSKSTDILCPLFRLPDLTGDRYPWDGYSMCNPDHILQQGEEKENVTPRSIVTCHYKGSLISGKVFDNSFDRGCPEAFRVNDLIEGFQMALCKMHVGDHWEVYIPWQKGYGKRSDADIPGYSTLVFEIKLLGIA